MMKKFFGLALSGAVMLAASVSDGAVITQWDFNSNPNDSNNATGVTTPAVGSGTVAIIGGPTATFASGDASGGSTDPNVGDDAAYNLTSFPAASLGNETAGLEFKLSTVGFENINVSFDQRHSNTSSRYIAVYYTLDGTNYSKFSVNALNASAGVTPAGGNPANEAGLFGPDGTFDGRSSNAGDDWFNGRSVDLSSILGANDNPDFGFRIVTSMAGGSSYSPTNGSSSYATSGTLRHDMVTFSGTAVPEPSTMMLGAMGLIGLVGYSLRRGRKS